MIDPFDPERDRDWVDAMTWAAKHWPLVLFLVAVGVLALGVFL